MTARDGSAPNAARRRADRLDRLVIAGRSLMQERGNTEFSVPDIVRRARTSLRAFYEFFSSKDELLLLVFAQAIAETAAGLHEAIERYADPVDQLQAYVHQLFSGTFADDHPEIPAMIGLHLHLATANPSALAEVLAPQSDILIGILQRGIAEGSFRSDMDVRSMAMMVSQTLIAVVHTQALGTYLLHGPVTVEEVWSYCFGGVASRGSTAS